MTLDVKARGVAPFAASCTAAADELRDGLPEANRDAADQVLGVVRPPIRTGYLASTIGAQVDALGFTLTAGAPYALAVHARDPFLTDALTRSEGAVVDTYTDHLTELVDHLKGK